jgi:predicted RND superfamily exporter protein
MNWLQSGGLLQLMGVGVLVYAVHYMVAERRARREAQRKALLKSTEQTIQAVLLEKRYSTRQGRR